MKEDPTKSPRHSMSPLRPALRKYQKPRLKRFGGLTEVTQTAHPTGTFLDSGMSGMANLFT
jgi:hypothetical protein